MQYSYFITYCGKFEKYFVCQLYQTLDADAGHWSHLWVILSRDPRQLECTLTPGQSHIGELYTVAGGNQGEQSYLLLAMCIDNTSTRLEDLATT